MHLKRRNLEIYGLYKEGISVRELSEKYQRSYNVIKGIIDHIKGCEEIFASYASIELEIPIDFWSMSIDKATLTALKKAHIYKLRDLVDLSDEEIASIKGVGLNRAGQIIRCIQKFKGS